VKGVTKQARIKERSDILNLRVQQRNKKKEEAKKRKDKYNIYRCKEKIITRERDKDN
jgi:hypothetical protein